MDLVGDAHGHEDGAGLEVEVVRKVILEVGLLQLPDQIRAGIVRVKVLQLDLGNETEAVVEFVGCEEDQAVDVEFVFNIAGIEMGLAVGAEADAVVPCHFLGGGK